MDLRVDVLGPLRVLRGGVEATLTGSRHRELVGRLTAARGRPVRSAQLVADLWGDHPPERAAGALATFVAEVRARLEPGRAPRQPARLLTTEPGGYALRVPEEATDAGRLRAAAAAGEDGGPARAVELLGPALAGWRGEPYADLPDHDWVRDERRALGELRGRAVEAYGQALLDLGRTGAAVPLLDEHAAANPWRERGWILLATALYRDHRQHDALDAVRRARHFLVSELGLDPTPALAGLEHDIRTQSPRLHPPAAARTRLRSTVDIARTLAIAGGDSLASAQRQRLTAAVAAESTGDPLLTARIVGAYDVPAVWSRSDDPDAAGQLVALIRRTLRRLPADTTPAVRARLLAALAVEHRGTRDRWTADAAAEAERIARGLGDASLLAFALNGRFMQSFQRPGEDAARDRIGTELVDLSTRHELPAFTILGHLVRMQALAGLGRFDQADRHAREADHVAREFESPVVPMLTAWFRAMGTARTGSAADAARAYRAADRQLGGVAMPGVSAGLLPLALLAVRLRHGRPAASAPDTDWGPYDPWTRPLVLLAAGDHRSAEVLCRRLPEPPADHLHDLLWAVTAVTAVRVGSPELAERARSALGRPEQAEVGAGSGLISLPSGRPGAG